MEKKRIQRAIGLERRNGAAVIKRHGGALKRQGQIPRKIDNKCRERERERGRDSDAISWIRARGAAKLRDVGLLR